MGTTLNGNGGKIIAPERNRYFYGKLMDVAQFEKEQRYFNQKRLLVNRLVIGSGVVCGLNVAVEDGSIRVEPGVAIDSSGREILVPKVVTVDPHQLTDDEGAPAGDPIDSGVVEICLAYSEVKVDPVPVLVPDCDTAGNCAHSTIRESFRVLVRLSEGNPPTPPACGLGAFGTPVNEWLHDELCDQIGSACPEPPPIQCVHLARVSLPLDNASVNSQSGRSLVYSNRVLYELILCLSEQVDQLSHGQTLRYVSGDGQSAAPGEKLADPLVVEVVDGQGNPVESVLVQFSVTGGDGKVEPETATTDSEGRAQTTWQLGQAEGEQQVTASAVATTFTVSFRATAVKP